MQQNLRTGLIVGLAIAIGFLVNPGTNIVPAAFAGGHHHGHHHAHHHFHHHHRGHDRADFSPQDHRSVGVNQRLNQFNACDNSICANSGSNSASIGSGSSSDSTHHEAGSVSITQSTNQANECVNSLCSNSGTNTANIR